MGRPSLFGQPVGHPREQTSRLDLLIFTSHGIVPVHESAVRIIPPSPNMQFEKCWYAVSIRAVNQQEGLALKHRRGGVIRQPGSLVHDELNPHQP